MKISTTSLWMATPREREFPQAQGDHKFDVVVIGGGITGLTTALLLAREGVDVALIEARTVGSGTTGHTTGKVTALQSLIYQKLESSVGKDGAAVYASANVVAMEMIAELVESYSIKCALEHRANHTYTEDRASIGRIEAEVEAAARAGLPVEFTEETELPFAIAGAVRLGNQMQLDAYRYCQGLAAAFARQGGKLFEGTRATDVAGRSDHFDVTCASGATITADYVVVATLLPFLDRGGFFAKTSPSQSYLTSYRTLGATPVREMYISADDPTRTLRSHAEFTLVGGETHGVGEEPDPSSRYQALADWAHERFGFDAPVHRWSSHDYLPIDDLPYVGRMPRGRAELLVATGMRKWGLTNGTAAAAILRDAVLKRDNDWADLFSSTRLGSGIDSAATFVKDNVDVARHFVGDRLRTAATGIADDLAPGDGKVAKFDGGEKVAMYRDDAGDLHELSPICPHMGCQLVWNGAEQTWDCPCHGSRFEGCGTWITGPSTSDMKRQPE